MSDLTPKLKQQLSPDGWHWLLKIGAIAADLNLPLYLVGGIVRDILLGRSSPDLDLVIEGGAIPLAQAVHEQYGGQLTTHEKFGTANWRPSENSPIDIDFVTARTETYSHPAALPIITPAPITADLFRRDFTINALAIRLDGDHLGTILDRYNSRSDLEKGVLRILHPQSFIDDPTRIWRGVRFEQRLGFAFEPQTLTLLHDALPYLKQLSADRIRHELELILQEANPDPALERLNELHILTAVSPGLHWYHPLAGAEQKWTTELGKLALIQHPRHELRLLSWLSTLSPQTIPSISDHLNLSRQLAKQCEQAAVLHQMLKQSTWSTATPPSAIAAQLAHLRDTPAVGFAASAPLSADIYQHVSDYYTKWRQITPHTTGHTLRTQGIPPGPIYRQILTELTDAWLDGHIHDRAAEQQLLQQILNRNL